MVARSPEHIRPYVDNALTQPVPWYHYIPLKPDYSDLYDIMAFFAGPIDEHGNINEALGHDVSVWACPR